MVNTVCGGEWCGFIKDRVSGDGSIAMQEWLGAAVVVNELRCNLLQLL